MDPRRKAIVEKVSGRALEIGIGTAQNARFYPPAASVVGVDPEFAMLARARRRVADCGTNVPLVAAAGEALPFADGSFDEVVVTLAFCSVSDPAQTLREVRRVLKPGGRLRFLEHVRSETPGWVRVQDALTPLWRRVAGG